MVDHYRHTPSPRLQCGTPWAYSSRPIVTEQRRYYSPELGEAPRYPSRCYTTDRMEVEDFMDTNGYGYLPEVSRKHSPSPRNCSPTYAAELDNYEHSMTQPFQDPRARAHSAYTRRRRNAREVSPARMKSGRAGGTWRHISQTNGHQGNNILFIEGTVKQSDSNQYPPYGWTQPSEDSFMHYVSPRLVPQVAQRQQCTPRATNYTSYYNNHARKGFKYWYEERKPKGASAPLNSIQSRLMSLRT